MKTLNPKPISSYVYLNLKLGFRPQGLVPSGASFPQGLVPGAWGAVPASGSFQASRPRSFRGLVSRSSHKLPRSFQKLPRDCQKLPKGFQKPPQASQKLPRGPQKLPGSFQRHPRGFPEASRSSQKPPRGFQRLPEACQKLPEAPRSFPEASRAGVFQGRFKSQGLVPAGLLLPSSTCRKVSGICRACQKLSNTSSTGNMAHPAFGPAGVLYRGGQPPLGDETRKDAAGHPKSRPPCCTGGGCLPGPPPGVNVHNADLAGEVLRTSEWLVARSIRNCYTQQPAHCKCFVF